MQATTLSMLPSLAFYRILLGCGVVVALPAEARGNSLCPFFRGLRETATRPHTIYKQSFYSTKIHDI